MEKMKGYREIAKAVMSEFDDSSAAQSPSGIDDIIVMDEARGHYQVLRWGWDKGHRAKWMVLYFRLKNGKFWIEQDMTEDGIATRLLEAGVPKEDIVLAFHEPEMRQYTEFAAA